MSWTTDSMHVSYSQYNICDFDVVPAVETLSKIFRGNSLVAAGQGHLAVVTGTHTGKIRLTVDASDIAPPLDLEAWDVIVDISHYSTNGETTLLEWGGGAVSAEFIILSLAGKGWYRVRVAARGRDAAMDATVLGEPIEEHAITVWPALPAPDHVHKIADAFGAGHWDPSRPPVPPVYPELEDDEDEV